MTAYCTILITKNKYIVRSSVHLIQLGQGSKGVGMRLQYTNTHICTYVVFGEFIHGLLKLLQVSNSSGTVCIQHQNPLPTGTQATLEVARYIHHSMENAKTHAHIKVLFVRFYNNPMEVPLVS